jgi:hypothetical protein
MTITSTDALITAIIAGQKIPMAKLVSRTALAGIPFSVFDLAGQPGAGVLAGTSVAAGVVPTDATVGCPAINAYTGANLGYLAGVQFGSTVAGRIRIFDLLFKAGAYAFNAAQTLAAQPSYAARVPGGTDFSNTQIWLEAVTAFTGLQSCAVTYTNDAGTAARTTGTVALGVAPTLGRMTRLPLQAGDTGVQKIETVTSTISTVGTFNVLVMRQIWEGRVSLINGGDSHGPKQTQLARLFADSALFLQVIPDSTATGIPEVMLSVING